MSQESECIARLRGLLAAEYGMEPLSLARQPGNETDKLVFLASFPNGVRWIVRMYTPENTRSNLAGTAAVLAALEESGFSAERLIRSTSGAAFVASQDWRLLATRFVAGNPLDDNLGTLHEVGALLGRLHALFKDSPLLVSLPVAQRTFKDEIRESLEDLNSVARLVPAHLRSTYAALHEACAATSYWRDLPHTLIHNDFHPENLLRTSAGELTVIDWDGAGRSPAILDIGFLFSSYHPKYSARPDPARIHALVDGYCRYTIPTSAELHALFDALRFRSLAFLTYELAQMLLLPGWKNEAYAWWELRYEASAETATIARARFEKNRERRTRNGASSGTPRI